MASHTALLSILMFCCSRIYARVSIKVIMIEDKIINAGQKYIFIDLYYAFKNVQI